MDSNIPDDGAPDTISDENHQNEGTASQDTSDDKVVADLEPHDTQVNPSNEEVLDLDLQNHDNSDVDLTSDGHNEITVGEEDDGIEIQDENANSDDFECDMDTEGEGVVSITESTVQNSSDPNIRVESKCTTTDTTTIVDTLENNEDESALYLNLGQNDDLVESTPVETHEPNLPETVGDMSSSGGDSIQLAETDNCKSIIDTTSSDIVSATDDVAKEGKDETLLNTEKSKEATVSLDIIEDAVPSSSVLTVTATATATADSSKDDVNTYHLKWFEWKGEQTPIITQNENGPCPLLAIANVLILARKINLPKMQQIISGKQLMEYIGDCILAEVPKQGANVNEELMLNFEQNMQDAIDIMHKLQTGIDVNVKFSGVTDFEFTRECIVFDLLKIQLYHGWLVDPQDEVHVKAVGGLSYNQLVEKMLMSKDAEGDVALEGMVIEEFLSRTASQLTYHGLCELNSTIQEEELCTFFRNNHFSTLYKHKGELFLLVTDQGFLTEPEVAWETLVNIEGDGQFVNSKFVSTSLQSSSNPLVPTNAPVKTMSQEDRDYLLALSLQEDVQMTSQGTSDSYGTDNDHKLALKLQEEENRLAQQQQQQRDIKLQKRGGAGGTTPQHGAQHRQSQQQQQQRSQQQQQQTQWLLEQQQIQLQQHMQQQSYKQQHTQRQHEQQMLQQQRVPARDDRNPQFDTPTHNTNNTLHSQPRQALQQQQQQQQQQPQQQQQQHQEKDKSCRIL